MMQKMVEDASPYKAAGYHHIHDVIDPRQTRNYLIQALTIAQNSEKTAASANINWPTGRPNSDDRPYYNQFLQLKEKVPWIRSGKKSWPAGVPETLTFDRGELPVHEYLRLRAREMPDKPAVIFYGRVLTFKELDQASDRFASFLLEQGVGRGDRVGLFMGNCPQYAIAHFGIQKIGAIVCPCSPLFKAMELAHQLNDAGIKILISWDLLMPVVQAALKETDVATVVVANLNDYLPEKPTLPLIDIMRIPKQAIPGTRDFMEIVSNDYPSPPAVDIDLHNEIGLLQYTGGTTGLPKGCMLTYYAALFKTAFVASVCHITPETVCLVTMPIFHIAGMLAGMNTCVYAGAAQVLITRFEPLAVMEAVKQYRTDFWYSAVPMNVAIMSHDKLPRLRPELS